MTTKTYVGDPVLIELECNPTGGSTDISAATALSIEARRPDRTIATWPGTLQGTTKVRYQADGDTLDQHGTWRLQAVVDMGDGDPFRGETALLHVYAAFG